MKCWECGNEGTKQFELKKMTYFLDEPLGMDIVSKRWYCDECYERIEKERKVDRAEYVRLKKKLMYERAVRLFEHQNVDLYEYKGALDKVKAFMEAHPEKFDSSQEVVAAAILIYNGLSISMQHKVAGYKVDFFIPKLKIVLEIDGHFHNFSAMKDSKRDIEIRNVLGKEFEIIRVGTKYIEENAVQLVNAIKELRAERQNIRSKNYGLLPEWYKK